MVYWGKEPDQDSPFSGYLFENGKVHNLNREDRRFERRVKENIYDAKLNLLMS